MDTTKKVMQLLQDRAAVGLEKYGTSVDRTDLSFEDWCQHAIEEMLDGAQYLMRVKEGRTTCYQCEQPAMELNEFSRCLTCATNSLKFNRADNEQLRHQLAEAEAQLEALKGTP